MKKGGTPFFRYMWGKEFDCHLEMIKTRREKKSSLKLLSNDYKCIVIKLILKTYYNT